MGIITDSYTLFYREMLIFKKNIAMNAVRSTIFPLLFVLLLGSFGSSPRNVPVAVVNYASGPAALKFINMLQSGSVPGLGTSKLQEDIIYCGLVHAHIAYVYLCSRHCREQ